MESPALEYNEIVYMTFMGFYDYKNVADYKGTYALAITNKRIMFGQKKLIGSDFTSMCWE
jgi:hypothetical protein